MSKLTPEFLQSCTPEQINKGVAWQMSINAEVGSVIYSSATNAFIEDNEQCISINTLCFCTSPNDAWPIILENEILIAPMLNEGKYWKAQIYQTKRYGTNPLRAAMEVFILMSVES